MHGGIDRTYGGARRSMLRTQQPHAQRTRPPSTSIIGAAGRTRIGAHGAALRGPTRWASIVSPVASATAQQECGAAAAPPRRPGCDPAGAPLCGGTAPKVPNGTEQLDGGFVAQCVYLELRARPPTVAVGAARRGRDRCVVARLPTRAPPAFTLRDDTDTLQAAAPACMHQPEEADNKWSAQLPLPPKHAEWELSDQMANNAVPSGSAPAVAEADSSRCRMHRGALPGSVAVSSSRSAGPSTTNNPPPCLALAMVLLILTHSSKLAAAGCVRSSDCGHGTCAPPVLGSQV
jgi:hypothetical protein